MRPAEKLQSHAVRLCRHFVLLAWGLSAVVGTTPGRADAVIRTRAMLATTVAEVFVEADRVAIEVEIGAADLAAFASMLPDPIYEQLGNEPLPLLERYPRFFLQDLVVVADDGEPLPALVQEMEPRPRIRRDELSGQPLPTLDGEVETVIYARFEYPLRDPRPSAISIGGDLAAGGAQIGFVLYHEGVAVNDFRYLTASQTVTLDWDDPWYSSFGTRALRRTYFAPMNGFLYIEPYEVRKEIILRPRDLQRFHDLGLEGRETIPVEMQEEMKREVAEFLRPRQVVRIDGREVTPDLARVNFLERTLTSSIVVDPPRELDLDPAILGVIFVYPTDGLPQRVTMDWDLFDERIQRIPVSAVDQAGPLPSYLEPDDSVLEWQNFLKHPELPTLLAISVPPSRLERAAVWLRWVMLALTGLLLAYATRRWGRERQLGLVLVGGLLLTAAATVGCFRAADAGGMDGERSREVVGGLLHNVYRAFDFRQEEQIYDVLAQSVEGALLTDIYLEMRSGLELANQGGARAKVKEIELGELTVAPVDAGGFSATTSWDVGGSVGHWGHVHTRRNRYRAELGFRPVDGVWKLTDLEILEEERL